MLPATESFFAIQLRPGEHPHSVAALVLQTAAEARLLFGRLDVLGTFGIGGQDFVRFRSDVINPFPFLDRILARGRATIASTPGSYLLRTPSGQHGRVSFTLMHTIQNSSNFRRYEGTRSGAWASQFEAA